LQLLCCLWWLLLRLGQVLRIWSCFDAEGIWQQQQQRRRQTEATG
jgi:hypothetical protein